MRIVTRLAPLAVLGLVMVPLLASRGPAADRDQNLAGKDPFEVPGKTQPAPGRVGKIAPVVLHPVMEVLVKLGDRVKKEQPLVKIDDDEAQADVRAKKASLAELRAGLARLQAEPRQEDQNEARASLENYRICTREMRHLFERIEPLWQKGSLPEQRYYEVRAGLAKCEAEERAAGARLERLLKRPFPQEVAELEARIAAAAENVKAAEAELEHYTVTAPIDGVVSTLDVYLGTVSRPGTSVWGEILDLREIDVRCDVTPVQADYLALEQGAEVIQDGRPNSPLKGRVTFIGIAADPRTGLIPVLVRLNNPQERLRCYINVRLRFGGDLAAQLSK